MKYSLIALLKAPILKDSIKMNSIINRIESYDDTMQNLTDKDIQGKTGDFKKRLKLGETLEDILPEAYAVCREATWRVLHKKPTWRDILYGVAYYDFPGLDIPGKDDKSMGMLLFSYLSIFTGRSVDTSVIDNYFTEHDINNLYDFLGLPANCA